MAAASYSPFLSQKGGADERALALKVFSGELSAAFERKSVVKDLLMSKTISHGKSAQFPAFGRAAADYHTKGANLLTEGAPALNSIKTAERIIYLDDVLISTVLVTELDEMLSHFDERAIYSDQLAEALARHYDELAIRQIIRSARTDSSDAIVPDGADENAGGFIGSATAVTTVSTALGDEYVGHFHDAAAMLDTRHVPASDRFALVTPDLYWSIVQSGAAVHRDYGNEGAGTQYNGKVTMAAGFNLVMTTNMPSAAADTTSWNGTGGFYNDYRGAFAGVQAVCFHRQAAATVKRMDVTLETERLIEYQGTLMLGKVLCGTGRLRPECSVEINSAVTQPSLTGA
jgi:hypothetical protein